ncbi:MAG: LCP family protein [Clostridia bacterium]|nr:LCP family protein [Clostridia bacterium]
METPKKRRPSAEAKHAEKTLGDVERRRKAIALKKKRAALKKKKRKRTILIVLGVVLALLLAVGGFAVYEYKKLTNDPSKLFQKGGFTATTAPATTVAPAPTYVPDADEGEIDPDDLTHDPGDFDMSDLKDADAPEATEGNDATATETETTEGNADNAGDATPPAPEATAALATTAAAGSATAGSAAFHTEASSTAATEGDDILNVLLIGVDYAEERLTDEWLEKGGSSAEHADVMIVLAINFTKQRVDMISLPRDTYAHIPGVQGIYKLNASLDCGGGLFKKGEDGKWLKDSSGNYIPNEKGFEKVMESCEWMLGGNIPIKHYYAVTMPAVKQLVDAIGGVDYDLDVTFSMQGRDYKPGKQHMNGQAVLDYLRVRKSGSGLKSDETGDGARVNRQKDMLVAILNQLRSSGMLTKIPEILRSFKGQLFTNCTFEQTTALALYAMDMPAKNIRMWSMDGIWSSKKSAKLNFCFTDQKKRVEIIKEVYGVDVPEYRDCTMSYAYWFWWDLQATRYLETCSGLKKALDGGNSSFTKAYKAVQSARAAGRKSAQNYLEGKSNYMNDVAEKLEKACENLRNEAIAAKGSIGYKKSLDFYSTLKRYNQIEVDPS